MLPAVMLDPAIVSAPTPAIGDVVDGKYKIEAVLGKGGMSVVYRATHLELGTPVALKVLSATALALPEYVTRLEREARATSQIRSEHVARVRDIGRLPQTRIPYLVMEYLNGEDLSVFLAKRGPLGVDLAALAVIQACEALAEAHALGIIHRDLKPANLFLTENVDGSPSVKVLDFGISRSLHRAALMPLTAPGIVLGTPAYMAPEQMEGNERVDARSDIWALGTILYELLVGVPPWTGTQLPQLFIKIMRSETPRPSTQRPGVPKEIDAIIARCLAIEPAHRYQSVAELAKALGATGSDYARVSADRAARVWQKCSENSDCGLLPTRPQRAVSTPLAKPLLTAVAAGVLIGMTAVGIHRVASARSRDLAIPAATTTTTEGSAVVLGPAGHAPAPLAEH